MFEVKHVESELSEEKRQLPKQMPLLTALPEDPVVKELKELDVNKMTPLEALEKLDELTSKLKKGK